MKRVGYWSYVLALSLLFGAPAGAAYETMGKIGGWTVLGTDGQCEANKQIEPNPSSQISIVLSREGTFLTVQDLRWRLPSTPTNMMRVSIDFDGSHVVDTEALLIGVVRAFQVFIRLTDIPDQVFWKRLFAAHSMLIRGDFRPGRVEINIEHAADVVPLMRTCAQRYLSGVELPF